MNKSQNIHVDYTGGIDLFSGLNERQIEAVSATEGYYRIIAGAGSGKTKTLTHRFAYLVRELGISPRNILCVTFTNKAANEMRGRIKKILGDGYDAALITTYHGFCVKVLKEDISRLFFPTNFKILDVSQQKKIIDEIYTEYEIKLDYSSFEKTLEYIYREKNHLTYIPMMIDPAYSFSTNNAVGLEEKIYIKYLDKQKKIYGLDFNDLLYFVIYLFEHNADILEKWKSRLHYIQVDEFQDSSKKELDIINMLCPGNDNLFVVGDPDQNIYEWRNSDNRFLVHFDKNYPDVRTIFLTQNYRSTPEILSVSNSLIEKNKNRVPKELFTKNQNGRPVEHVHLKNEEEEAKWIADKIREIIKSGCLYSDIAILFRSSFVSRFIEQSLYREDIPYVIHGGVRFFDRMEIKDSVAFLKLINDNDDEAFLRIVNVPKRQIGKTRIEFLKNMREELISEYGLTKSLFEILCDNYDHGAFVNTQAEEFVNIITEFREKAKDPKMKVSELLNGVLEKSGYKTYISRSGDMERFDNVTELLSSITEFEQQAGEDISLEVYLQQLAVISDYESERNQNCVKLMTIHSSKGLEFPHVIIAGMTDGVFPSRRTLEERKVDGLEEERRLCYVAMTRAMHELYMVESEGNTYGEAKKLPSRFIYDVEPSYLNNIGVVPEDIIKDLAVRVKQTGKDNKKPGKASTRPVVVSTSPRKYGSGDIVTHRAFGVGKIVDIDETNATYMIRFGNSDKPKPINIDYPGITLADKEDLVDELVGNDNSGATANLPVNEVTSERDNAIMRELEKQLDILNLNDVDIVDIKEEKQPPVAITQRPAIIQEVLSEKSDEPPLQPQKSNFSNFNRKLDRLFGNKGSTPMKSPKKEKVLREPEIFHFPESEDDLKKFNDNNEFDEFDEMEEVEEYDNDEESEGDEDDEIEEIVADINDINNLENIDNFNQLDVGQEEIEKIEEIDRETDTAPVALYDAPPQILYDNDARINLWEDPNVPKKGWVCVDVIDLGQPIGECGMCGKEDIRYVHIMRHEIHQSIGAGCVCAGKMEGNIDAAKERENSLKNKINRFKTFSVTDFKTSAKGNLYTKYKNTVITFMKSKKDDGGWNFVENGEFSSYFKTLDEAKRAAFEKVDGRRQTE